MSSEDFLRRLSTYLTTKFGLQDVLTEMPRDQGFFEEPILWSINAETDLEPFETYETVDGKIVAGYGPAAHVGDIVWEYLVEREKYSDIVDYKELSKIRDEIMGLLRDRKNWQNFASELSGLVELLKLGDEIANKISAETGLEVRQALPSPPSKNAFFYAVFDSKGLNDEAKIEKIGKAWVALSDVLKEFSKQEDRILEEWRKQIEEKRKKGILPEDEAFAKALSELLISWTSRWCSYEIPSGFPGFEGGSAKWLVRTRSEPYIFIFETEDRKVTVAYETFRTHTSVAIDHKRGEDVDRVVLDMSNKENWQKYRNTDLKDVIERYELGEELAKKAKEITGIEVKYFIPRKHCHDAAFYVCFDSKGMNIEKKIEEIKKLIDLLRITYDEFKKADEEIKT
ncbi:MAG: hypothetical protein ACUVQ0_05485 [Thermoproteota archaeon]